MRPDGYLKTAWIMTVFIQHHPSASFTNTPAILYRIKGQTTSRRP